jgi:hypothetical protein
MVKRYGAFIIFRFPINGKSTPKDSDEKGIMGMLHGQAILARSKELTLDRSQIQDPSIGIKAGNQCSLHSTQLPPAAGVVFQYGTGWKREGH